MEIKPRLFYQVEKKLGRPWAFNLECHLPSIINYLGDDEWYTFFA